MENLKLFFFIASIFVPCMIVYIFSRIKKWIGSKIRFVPKAIGAGIFIFISLIFVVLLLKIDLNVGVSLYAAILGVSIAIVALTLTAEATYNRECEKARKQQKEQYIIDYYHKNLLKPGPTILSYSRYQKNLSYVKDITYWSIRSSFVLALLSLIGLLLSSDICVGFNFNISKEDYKDYKEVFVILKNVYDLIVISICIVCFILTEKISTIFIDVEKIMKD